MRIFLSLLAVLCATQIHGIYDLNCPRKDPPPGALVVSPGSKLILTCKGHVVVDGVKVNISKNSSNTNSRGRSSAAPTTTASITNNRLKHSAVTEGYHPNHEAGVSAVTEENRGPRHTDTTYTASPTTRMVQPTSESGWTGEEGDRSSVTRGLNSEPLWRWNGRMVGNKGATLSLSSVRETDSGTYTCHHRGREKFALKVIVAAAPQKPSLFCYKKSPSSKIRCESEPQNTVAKQASCSLVLSKRPKNVFLPFQCSYSTRLSRYWWTLDHNEDELRTIHMAYMCIRNVAGNTTSKLLPFIPMDILKPDPPSDVRVKEEEGHEMWIKVTWNVPLSWKAQDSYYRLIYEVKYKPLHSSFHHNQATMTHQRSHTITDAIPGVRYMIQVRTREEYDGKWSEWSAPVNGSSWTVPNISEDLFSTTFPEEGSTVDYMADEVTSETGGVEVSHHILWISGSFVLLSVILAAYIFRHKDKLMSKLHRVTIIQSGDSSHPPPSAPPAPPAPEAQALVTFTPTRYKEPPLTEVEGEEEENEEEQRMMDRTQAMHFNNTSYFLIQKE